MKIPKNYTLLTVENARVGLQFTKSSGRLLTIRKISGHRISTIESAGLFDLRAQNKFVLISDLTLSQYVYGLNQDYIGDRPGGFSLDGHMDYMLDLSWRYYSTEPLNLAKQLYIRNTNSASSRETWCIRPDQLVLLSSPGMVMNKAPGAPIRTDVPNVEPEPTKPVMTWSNTRRSSTYFVRDYLLEQIQVRYASISVDTLTKNSVVDSCMPSIFQRNGLNTTRTHQYLPRQPQGYFAISPWYAQLLNVQAIPASDLCRVLGYTTKMLKTLMNKVKRKKYTASFIGYGGTNINTIYWLSEIAKFTGVYSVFNKMSIYEPEEFEVSNLLRFPKNPALATEGSGASKLALLTDEPTFLCNPKNSLCTSYSRFTPSNNLETSSFGKLYSPNTVFYGAPGLETRIMLSSIGNFISATHGSAECSLHLNPAQDTQLQVESYGVIQLNTFFMNQIRMAIGFLEILASDQDLSEQDKELMSYSFDGVSKLKTLKKYNFGITQTNTIPF